MQQNRAIKIIFMLLPCVAVITGLYICHNVWTTMILYNGIIVVSLFIFRESGFPKKIIKGMNLKLAVFYSVITGSCGFFIYLLWPLLKINQTPLGDLLVRYGLYEQQWIFFILYYSLVTPLLEEYFWRELMGSNKKGPDISDFLFAGYHLPVVALFVKPIYILLIFLVLSGTACLWRNIKNRQKGLFIPFISHLIADVSTIFAVFLLHNNVLV